MQLNSGYIAMNLSSDSSLNSCIRGPCEHEAELEAEGTPLSLLDKKCKKDFPRGHARSSRLSLSARPGNVIPATICAIVVAYRLLPNEDLPNALPAFVEEPVKEEEHVESSNNVFGFVCIVFGFVSLCM